MSKTIKRPKVDLTQLTSEVATPMPEAAQRGAGRVPSDQLEPLAFKVPPAFRKRFKQCALDADLKQNELLFKALDAWEEKQTKLKH